MSNDIQEKNGFIYDHEPGSCVVKGEVVLDENECVELPVAAIYGVSKQSGMNYGVNSKLTKHQLKRMTRLGDLFIYSTESVLQAHKSMVEIERKKIKEAGVAAKVLNLRFEEVEDGYIAFAKIKLLKSNMSYFLRSQFKNPESKILFSLSTFSKVKGGVKSADKINSIVFKLTK